MLRDNAGGHPTPTSTCAGDGVQIGTNVFQSFSDVQVWVKSELPDRCYGLFVDAVSFLDFFTCCNHTDAETTLTAFHSQQKSGFTSMYESRVTASVQNIFPMVFGKLKESNFNDSDFLPAISEPSKWDTGSKGLKHKLTRGMRDVERQLENAINTILPSNSVAQHIAKVCLYKSKLFSTELFTL